MNDKEALEFKEAIEKLCGEANEAANLALVLFKDDELKMVRRELARIMELVELRILPIYQRHFPSKRSLDEV